MPHCLNADKVLKKTQPTPTRRKSTTISPMLLLTVFVDLKFYSQFLKYDEVCA
jgi:hypothetical protein